MLRKAILCFVLLDNFIVNSLKRLFPTRYKIVGSCKTCGNCCQVIRLHISPNFLGSKLITDLVVRWISWIFNFYLIEIDYKYQALVFGCYDLGEDGKCKVYRWRPGICRNYPLLDYFKEPVFLPGCGFKAKVSLFGKNGLE